MDAEVYAKRILSGEIPSGKFIKLACKRFLDDLERDDIYFDKSRIDKVINFFEKYLYHFEGKWAGTPIKLELWQKFILTNIFGCIRKETGLRRYSSVYIQVGRKNAKSTLAAGMGLYHITLDNESSPQFFVGANNEDQARICIKNAGGICQVSPMFREEINNGNLKLFNYMGKTTGLKYNPTGGIAEVLNKKSSTKDGLNPSFAIIDEYHEAPDDSLLNVIESGTGARKEPLLIVITTAGYNKQGPCYSILRETSIDILTGRKEDDNQFIMIYEPDKGDDWKDRKTWIKANPNYGVSVIEDRMEVLFQKAVNEGGSKEVDFKTKNLNMWVDAAEVWVSDEVIAMNNHTVTDAELHGKECYGGLDLARSTDLNAFVLYFPDVNGFQVVKSFFWLPEDKLRDSVDTVNYHKWIESGHMIKTAGQVIDINSIADVILQCYRDYDLRAVGYDRFMEGHGVIKLVDDSAGGLELIKIGQGFVSMSQPMKDLESSLLTHKVDLMNNPVMRWMFGNVIAEKDSAGNIKPSKKLSKNKIDGISALVTAKAAFTDYLINNKEKGFGIFTSKDFQ